MQSSTLVLLSGALFFVCGTLIFLLREEHKLKNLILHEKDTNRAFAVIFHQVDDLLTSIKWHTEMLFDQDAGKLNIAQEQLLNKIQTSVVDANRLLKKSFPLSGTDFSGKIQQEKMSGKVPENDGIAPRA